MPDNIIPVLEAYSKLIEQLKRIIGNNELTPAQAIMIMTLGTDIVRAGDLIRLGYYYGTNSTYNLHTLQRHEFIEYLKNNNDKRLKLVKLTDKGLEFCVKLRRELASEQTTCPE